MRKNRILQSGGICLAVTLILAFYWWQTGSGGKPGPNGQTLTRDVLMPMQTIPARTPLIPDMFRVQAIDVRKESVPPNAIRSLQEIEGKVSFTTINPGQPVTAGQVKARADLGLAAQLPPGLRAMTIQVTDTSAVAGLLRPADRVDVLATTTTGEEGSMSQTNTLLQGVQVVAVGKKLSDQQLNEAAAANLVTIAVTPAEARMLTLAQTRATLQLVLRPLGDEMALEPPTPPALVTPTPRPRTRQTPRVRQATRPRATVRVRHETRPAPPEMIYPIVPPVPRPAPAAPALPTPRVLPAASAAPAPRTVEVIRGTKRENVPVDNTVVPAAP